MQTHPIIPLVFFVFLCFPCLLNVSLAGARVLLAGDSPLTPKAYLSRYWDKEIHNNLPKSQFILSKASPLNAVEAASFAKLAAENALSIKLSAFCSSAKLFCFPHLAPSLEKHDENSDFTNENKNFTDNGTGVEDGVNFFRGYSDTASEYSYLSSTADTASEETTTKNLSGSLVNKWIEPGMFFRESELKEGNVMPMPDIRDMMPPRSFLPRSITSKLPFSTSKIAALKETFHAVDNSTMEKIIIATLNECEREPSPGETKRCVGSAEDLIDFATSILGRNVVVRTTENVKGSKKDIMIGSVKGINGGKVTRSVSCHQNLYPYLLYYCHSVPKVRVYEADILDTNSKAKINHGVAICHLDTSSWSPTHQAFLTLGSGPGRIEVCHWIFENHMAWTTAENSITLTTAENDMTWTIVDE